jgi:hypothetical protein
MITYTFIKIIPAYGAQTFTIWAAQWADGYLQQKIFTQDWVEVYHACLGHQQTRIRHITLGKGVQFGEIDNKELPKVGQTAYAFEANFGFKIHL